jgi:hypothetical protein
MTTDDAIRLLEARAFPFSHGHMVATASEA